MVQFVSAPRQWSRGLWEYYQGYTRRRVAIHAVATAALTAFGLLATYNRVFVGVAVAAYVLPPVYLYATGDEFETERESSVAATAESPPAEPSSPVSTDSAPRSGVAIDGDTDTDGVDTDSDGPDGDSDADGRDADADSDGRDADTDADG